MSSSAFDALIDAASESKCNFSWLNKNNIIEYCEFNANTKKEFLTHKKGHIPNSLKPVKCFYCQFGSTSKWHSNKHIERSHFSKTNIKFHALNKVIQIREKQHPYIEKTQRKRKEKIRCNLPYIVNGKEYYCENRSEISSHFISHKRTDGKYGCSVCSFQTITAEHVKRHISSCHSEFNKLVAPIWQAKVTNLQQGYGKHLLEKITDSCSSLTEDLSSIEANLEACKSRVQLLEMTKEKIKNFIQESNHLMEKKKEIEQLQLQLKQIDESLTNFAA